MSEKDDLNLSLEDGRRALAVHVYEKGTQLRKKYGKFIDYPTLQKILMDEEFVRYPTTVEFCSSKVDPGMFASAEKVTEADEERYIIYVHESFKTRLNDVPAMVLYHLVSVNYGDFASANEAEDFGCAALGLEKEYYYQLLCRLADSISE